MPQFIIGTGLIGIHCRMPGRRGGSQFIYQKRGASGDAADLVMDFPILYLGELRRESKIREGGNNAANKALPGTLDLSRGGGLKSCRHFRAPTKRIFSIDYTQVL